MEKGDVEVFKGKAMLECRAMGVAGNGSGGLWEWR